MKTSTIVLTVFCMVCVNALNQDQYSYDATKELFGRVLHFESKQDRGIYVEFDKLSFIRDETNREMKKWFVLVSHSLKGFENLWPLCSHHSESNIYTEPMTMFKFVKSDNENWVVIESVPIGGYYMTLVKYWTLGKPVDMRRVYAKNKPVYQWQIKCKDSSYEDCIVVNGYAINVPISFVPCKLTLSRDYRKKGRTCLTVNNNNPRMIIHAPDPSQRWIEIDRLYNNQGTTMEYTIRYTSSKTITETTKTSVSIEIGAAFKAFSASASTSMEKTWETVSAETFTKEHERTIKVSVLPHKTLYVRQLTGYYGPFTVATKVLEFSNDKTFKENRRRK